MLEQIEHEVIAKGARTLEELHPDFKYDEDRSHHFDQGMQKSLEFKPESTSRRRGEPSTSNCE